MKNGKTGVIGKKYHFSNHIGHFSQIIQNIFHLMFSKCKKHEKKVDWVFFLFVYLTIYIKSYYSDRLI